MGFVIVHEQVLEASPGISRSLALDLHDQNAYMEKTDNGVSRRLTHVVGGAARGARPVHRGGRPPARGARYASNCAALVDGMKALGFGTFLERRAVAGDRHVPCAA